MSTKAPRGTRTNGVEESDHSTQSSPDPLALSPVSLPRKDRSHSSKVSRLRKNTRTPLSRTSRNAQQPARRSGDAYETKPSPSKSFIMNTDGTAGASPWRIKVIVEAEPHPHDATDENFSPMKSPVTRTRTTTIPLKDLDNRAPVKRRGRPKKSETDKAETSKRSNTPARRKSSNRRGSVQSRDTAMTSEDAGLSDTPPKVARARARKATQELNDRSDELVGRHARENSTTENTEPCLSVTPTDEYSQVQRTKHTMFNFSNLTPLHQKHALHTPQPQATQIRTPDPTMKPVHGRRCTPVKPSQWPVQDRISMSVSSALDEQETEDVAQFIQGRKSTYRGPLDSSEHLDQAPNSSSLRTSPELLTDRPDQLRGSDMRRSVMSVQDHEQMSTVDTTEDSEDSLDVGDSTSGEIGEETMLRSEEFSIVSISSLPSIREPMCYPSHLPAATPTAIEVKQPPETGVSQDSTIFTHDETRGLMLTPGPITGRADIPVTTPFFMPSSPPVALVAQQAPWVSTQSPSCPPTLELPHVSPEKTSTPELVKVVRAGVALQGVLDTTSRSSPVRPLDAELDQQKKRLDALFSGFGEGTRKELQAGLRLGEQLANRLRQHSTNTSISPPGAGSADLHLPRPSNDDVFGEPVSSPAADFSYPRLPTPEEKDHYALALPLPPSARVDVDYPSLNVSIQQAHLISPARSEGGMSWRVDTALRASHSTSSNEQETTAGTKEHNHLGDGESQGVRPTAVPVKNTQKTEGYTDIWLEEASRSPSLPSTTAAVENASNMPSPQSGDPLASDGLLKPKRSKLPKTWRRTSGSDFSYSDEAEPQAEALPPVPSSPQEIKAAVVRSSSSHSASSQASSHSSSHGGKTPSESTEEDEGDQADDGDGTGTFWQHNLPAIFQKPVPHNLKGDRIDLSMLLDPDNSPLQSSPLHRPHHFTPIKYSPFKSIPLANAPTMSSPLKWQAAEASHEKDASIDDSVIHNDLSRLSDTMTSDIRQLKMEMEFAQHEMSTHGEQVNSGSEQNIEQDEGEEREGSSIVGHLNADEELATSPILPSVSVDTNRRSPLDLRPAQRPLFPTSNPTKTTVPVAAPAHVSLLTRFTSTLWSALPFVASQPMQPTHHLLANYPLLPKYEPWSKTHYKALDHLYQRFKAEPSLFAPLDSSNKGILLPKSTANAELRRYVSFQMRNWGYEVQLRDQHMIIVGLYMQLLQLASREEYALREGREIEILETEVGKPANGDLIGVREVAIKLFTVVAGEMVRMDEKMGMSIDRSSGQWMQKFRGGEWELLG